MSDVRGYAQWDEDDQAQAHMPKPTTPLRERWLRWSDGLLTGLNEWFERVGPWALAVLAGWLLAQVQFVMQAAGRMGQ